MTWVPEALHVSHGCNSRDLILYFLTQNDDLKSSQQKHIHWSYIVWLLLCYLISYFNDMIFFCDFLYWYLNIDKIVKVSKTWQEKPSLQCDLLISIYLHEIIMAIRKQNTSVNIEIETMSYLSEEIVNGPFIKIKKISWETFSWTAFIGSTKSHWNVCQKLHWPHTCSHWSV